MDTAIELVEGYDFSAKRKPRPWLTSNLRIPIIDTNVPCHGCASLVLLLKKKQRAIVKDFFTSLLLGTGHKVRGGGLAEIGGGSSIFKLTKRGGSPKYWSCLWGGPS